MDERWAMLFRATHGWHIETSDGRHELPAYQLRESDRAAGYTRTNGPLPEVSEDRAINEDAAGGYWFASTLREAIGNRVVIFDGLPVEGAGWAFWIGRTVVTERQWNAVTGDVATKPDHPKVLVSWHDAVAFCELAGLELPPEEAWEHAATASDGRLYPWGNADPTNDLLCWSGSGTYRRGPGPADGFPLGASPFGVLQMSGGVWEWTASPWAKDDPSCEGMVRRFRGEGRAASGDGGAQLSAVTRGGSYNSAGMMSLAKAADLGWMVSTDKERSIGFRAAAITDNGSRVIRGGSWYFNDASWARSAVRDRFAPSIRSLELGFRCARGAAAL